MDPEPVQGISVSVSTPVLVLKEKTVTAEHSADRTPQNPAVFESDSDAAVRVPRVNQNLGVLGKTYFFLSLTQIRLVLLPNSQNF